MADNFVDQIFALYRLRGHERYGERVTQFDHALQCAALARAQGRPDTLVAAALLHDYGHLIDDRGHLAEREGIDGAHEAVGADALSAWFGPAVTQPIALHVAAKRYLCAVEPRLPRRAQPGFAAEPGLQGGAARAARSRRLQGLAVRRRSRAAAPLGRLGQGAGTGGAADAWKTSVTR